MATIAKVGTRVASGKVETVLWETMATGDTGDAHYLGDIHPGEVMVQATGTFNGGTSIAIEGSVDGTNYASLEDLDGTTIALTAAGIKGLRKVPLYVRPKVTAGSADDVDVTMLVRFLP